MAAWTGYGGGYGLNGVALTTTLDPASNLYAGGEFTMAGDCPALHVARWDPASGIWSNLGTGVDSHAHVLLSDTSGVIYAGGNFTSAGGIPASRIAAWYPESRSWSNLGSGVNGDVHALAIDGQGRLYAGGEFSSAGGAPAQHIARWDPVTSSWTGIGDGLDGGVNALAIDSNGVLFAGGWFSMAGGVPADYIARWDGTAWSPLGSGLNDEVTSLAFDGAGRLFVGGYFSIAGGIATRAVAIWDEETWAGATLGISCSVLTLAYDSTSNRMFAAGWIACSAGSGNTRLAQYDGTNWLPYAVMNGMITTVLAHPEGGVYAGGLFSEADQNRYCRALALCRGDRSEALGQGFDNTIDALAFDADGAIVVGGWFHTAGTTNTRHVARRDASQHQWTSLGTGTDNGVMALATGPGNRLYAGGGFTNAGGITANHVAMWNGSVWTNMCNGLNGLVTALAVDHSGRIYAGGEFTNSGLGCKAAHVARWNGSTWTNLGDGLSPSPDATVHALAVDSQGFLYAGGSFTNSGGLRVSNVARWDPLAGTWTNLGLGVDLYLEVHALAVDGLDRLYVGGHFTNAGGVAARHIARWDPDTGAWTNLGEGLDNTVMTIAIDQHGRVFAGGEFTRSGTNFARGVAMWDGATWQPLDHGVDGPVLALAITPDGDLLAGGDFWTAGGSNAPHLARYTLPDRDADGLPDWWEQLHYGSETNVTPWSIAANGTDSTLAMFIADLDPQDPESTVPEPLIACMPDNHLHVLVNQTSTGRIYGLVATTNLLAAPQVWTSCIPEQSGNGGTLDLTVPESAERLILRTVIRIP